MKLSKLLVNADLPFVRKNIGNIEKWKAKKWRHGKTGNGKCVASDNLWKKIAKFLEGMDVEWIWEPQGKTYESVFKSAQSMALLPVDN